MEEPLGQPDSLQKINTPIYILL